MEAFLDECLLEPIKCPICKYYMHPPIRQCILGHGCCIVCFSRLKKCPTCQRKFSRTSRPYGVETIHDSLNFPCKFKKSGCEAIVPGPEIMKHELDCEYGDGHIQRECPLKMIDENCKWTGLLSEATKHCRLHHPYNVYKSSRQKLACNNFKRDETEKTSFFFIFFEAYSEYFMLAWDVVFATGIMRWCVFTLKEPEHGCSFKYRIHIENRNNPTEYTSLESQCDFINDDKGGIFKKSYVLTHYDVIRRYCKNDEFFYTVKIFKNKC